MRRIITMNWSACGSIVRARGPEPGLARGVSRFASVRQSHSGHSWGTSLEAATGAAPRGEETAPEDAALMPDGASTATADGATRAARRCSILDSQGAWKPEVTLRMFVLLI